MSRIEHDKEILKIRADPIYFFKYIINIDLYPKQEEFIREFYRHKYNKDADEYKKLVLILGQRCISGDSLVLSNKGYKKIKSLKDIGAEYVYNGSKWVKFTDLIYVGKKQKWIVTTEYGFQLECSGDHKVFSNNKWISVSELNLKDKIAICNNEIDLSNGLEFSKEIKNNIQSIYYKGTKSCSFPVALSTELAQLLGYLIADGTINRDNRAEFTKENEETLLYYKTLVETLFHCDIGVNAKETSKAKTITILHSQVCKFIHALGMGCWTSHTKQVPDIIMSAPQSIKTAFLQGYFDGDGSSYLSSSNGYVKPVVSVTSVSDILIKQIKLLLLECGINSSISISKSVEFNSRIKRENNAYTLRVYGKNIIPFENKVGFITSYKSNGLKACVDSLQRKKSTFMPALNTSEVRVKSIVKTDEFIDMYDLHVPEGNCYIANGILVHNSGKTLIGAGILLYEFHELLSYDNPHAHYGVGTNNKGEPMKLIGCTCVSTSKDQASDGVFANVKLLLKGSDYFKKYYLDDLHITDLRIDCDDKMIFLMVKAPKIDTAAGYENKIVLYDEMDLMQYGSTTQKNDTRGSKVAAHNVYSKLNNSTQTFGSKGKIVAMSSLQRQDGIMMLAYNEALSETDALAISAKTWEVNPNPELREEVLRERYKNRMDEFYRDFANMPEVGGSSLFPERVRLNKSITNVLLNSLPLPEEYNHPHVLAIDPASHNDSFGVACAFRHDNKLVVDGARKFNKPLAKDSFIKPSDIQDFINLQMERLNVYTFITDVYHYPNILEDVRDKWGIEPLQKFADGESYSLWRELQNDIGGTQLHVVYDEALENECNSLTYVERGISGKLNVDHPYKGSKDTADAVCNCIWYLATNPETEPYIPYSTVFTI